jgi:hypothetical protein
VSDYVIPERLAEQLENIARLENRSPDEVLEDALQHYATDHSVEITEGQPKTRNLLLLIAQAAEELGEGSKEGDIAERSREILNNDFPEYLMRRMRGDYSDVEK